MTAIIPLLIPVSCDATEEHRMRVYRQYLEELVKYNPRSFLPPGVVKRWYHSLIGLNEYPAQLLVTGHDT